MQDTNRRSLWERLRSRRHRRGQSLVEFALVLPLLLVLLMICLDFGRIFLGYVNLQSMARIGANYAATNPTAWLSGDATVKARYQSQITNDATATNCTLPKVGGTPTAPDPTFSGANLGDTATVSLSCSFQVLTPIISNILGGSVTVSSSAAFPVKSAMIASGGGSVLRPTAILTAMPTSGAPGMTVTFDGSLSMGSITSWFWDFANGQTSNAANPAMPITYPSAGSYTASLTVSNSAGSSTDTVAITVAVPPLAIAFDTVPNPATGPEPLTVTFHDKTTGLPANPTFLWAFGDGQTSTAQNPTHVYNAAGTYDVSLTVSGVGPVVVGSVVKKGLVVVTANPCTVPDFRTVTFADAQTTWAGKGFTTQVNILRNPKSTDLIGFQSIVGNSQVVCTATIDLAKN